MQLLRPADVPMHAAAGVYRYSRLRAVMGMLAALGAASGAALFAWIASAPPLYGIAGLIALGMWFAKRAVRARFAPSNWLVRMTHDGIYVQLRSYLNQHLPAQDRSVVFIPFGEIRALMLGSERRLIASSSSPRHRGNVKVERRRLVVLDLAADASALACALAEELTRKAPREPRWYGSSAVFHRHHPARMAAPDRLEIEWNVVPVATQFRDALLRAAPHVASAQEPVRTISYLDVDGLDREEQEKRLRELIETGDALAAIRIVRQIHGCDLAEARRRVDEMRARASRS
jgi:hypothetical protein